MATGVYFGSPRSLILSPGAYSLVDASALNFTPPFSFNTVLCLGPATGGQPFTPYLFKDAAQAQNLFGIETPLAELCRFAFMGGVNGGASAVVGMRVDNAAQATGSLVDNNSGTEINATFKDWGAYGNTYSLAFYPASTAGMMAVVSGKNRDGSDYSLKIDNQTSFSNLIELINLRSPITAKLVAGGQKAKQTLTLATSQIDGRGALTDSQEQARISSAYIYQYPATMLENTEDSMLLSTTSTLSWAIDSVDAGTDTITTSATHGLVAGNFARFEGTALGANISATKQYVVSTAPTGTTLTVVECLESVLEFVVSTVNMATDTLTAPGHTLANNDVVQLAGDDLPTGYTPGRNVFVISVSGDNFQISLTRGGSAIDLSGTISNVRVVKVAGSTAVDLAGTFTAAKVIVDVGYATVAGSNPTDFNGSRVAARTIDGYTQTLTSAIISDAAYSSDSARFTLAGADTWGYVDNKGMPGAVFTIASGTYTGTYQVLHYEFDGLGSDQVRIVRKLDGDRKISAGSFTGTLTWRPSIQFPRLQPAATALESLLPANGLLVTGGQYLSFVAGDKTFHYATQQGDRIDEVALILANYVNSDDEVPVVVSTAYNASTYTATLTVTAETPGTAANTLEVDLLVNVQTTVLVSSQGATLDGGIDPDPPRNAQGQISGSFTLKNGYDSAPTYLDYLKALDEIAYLGIRYIVVATDDLGVQVAIADHCAAQSSTPKRRERMCVLGHGRGWTQEQVRSRAEIFNSERVVFVSPDVQMPDSVTGLPRWYPSYYMAARVAGMLAAEGNGISDPITHTYAQNLVNVGIRYHSGSTELDAAIASGVLTVERDAALTRTSQGWRVTAGITTWRVTVNSALKSNVFEAINIVNQSDFIAADIREMEETLFIGGVILPETLEQVTEAVNKRLDRRTTEKIIYGFDPTFTEVTRNQDNPRALDVAYRIYPAFGLDFILNTQLLAPAPTEETVTVIS